MVVAHKKSKIAALIIFAVVCVIIFLELFKAAGGSLGLSSSYTVSAIIPDTFNLIPDADVDAAGVRIGTISSVVPDGKNAKVTFTINTKTNSFPPLYKNATDQVRTKTLVGESYLSIYPGTPSAGKIPDNGTIPVSRNLEAVPLQDILGMFTPATRAGVEADMKGLGNGLQGHGAQLNTLFGELNPSIDNTNQLMEILNPERKEVASLTDDSGVVMNAIGERTSQFQSLVGDAKNTAEAVQSQAANLKTTLADLPGTLSQVQTTVTKLNGFSTNATPVFKNLRTAATDLTPAIQQLEPTAVDGQKLFAKLQPFLTKFGPLVKELKPGANSLKTLVGPLDATLRQADPALAYFAPFSNDFASFFSNVGSIADTADGLGDRGRAFAMVGPVDYTNLSPEAENLINALIKTGTFSIFSGGSLNPYPEPNTGNDPGSQEAYKLVKEMP